MPHRPSDTVELAEVIALDLRSPMRTHIQRVLSTLKVEARGRDDRLRNFPETAAVAPSWVEEEIHAQFKGGGADPLNAWVEKALQRATEGVHAIELGAEEKEPGRVVDDTIAAVHKAIAYSKQDVAKARGVERTGHRELRHFKDEHGLKRAARYTKESGMCAPLAGRSEFAAALFASSAVKSAVLNTIY